VKAPTTWNHRTLVDVGCRAFAYAAEQLGEQVTAATTSTISCRRGFRGMQAEAFTRIAEEHSTEESNDNRVFAPGGLR